MSKENTPRGAFIASLTRNNKKIRKDRAIAIYEDVSLLYKREVEDIQLRIKRLQRERAGLLDLSPTTADSLILASDFDATKFVAKDIQLGLDIRNLNIKLEVAEQRHKELFEGELFEEVEGDE